MKTKDPRVSVGLGLVLAIGCAGSMTSGSESPESQDPGGGNPGTGPGGGSPGGRDPGRVVLRRLTRNEYNNTVRDLLGTSARPADRFPGDFGGGNEFDNNADRLATSPVLLGLHETAVDQMVEEAFTSARARVLSCDPQTGNACLRELAAGFGAKAWRRPLAAAEVDELVALGDKARMAGASPDEVAKTVAKALLLSPYFLMRVELDPNPASPAPHPVGQYELASRLSYFLWTSMPDDTLFASARAAKLHEPAELQAQIDRMLKSPKAQAFPASFAGQWLGTITLDKHEVDASRFGSYDAPLADAMKREPELLMAALIRDNHPTNDLLQARFAFLNARLAKHYGLPAPAKDWQQVSLTSTQRGGVLGLGGLLTATSYANRTSVVKRGAWVLGNLLCSEPPPPPPDVPKLNDGPAATGTQRQILEAHRSDPQCSSCHATIDGIGFALEHYDAIGAWRQNDQGRAIDDLGTLPGGVSFKGQTELASTLVADSRFAACMARKLTTYALARDLGASDDAYLADLTAGPIGAKGGFADLVARIVASDLFRMRRGEP